MGRDGRGARVDPVEIILLAFVAAPVVGLLMGGVYSMPAIRVTRGREPWLSLLLCGGLAITIAGLGTPLGVPAGLLAIVWAATAGLLLAARSLFGGLDQNLERFGLVRRGGHLTGA